MIISALIGGLGNQMFQYAAARALSLSLNDQLLVDLSGFDGYNLHQGYQLENVFGLSLEAASEEQVRAIIGWRFRKNILKILRRPPCVWLRGSRLAIEPHFNYWTGLSSMGSPCYMTGYWQSERYIRGYELEIRKDFHFGSPLDGKNFNMANEISKCASVSLHIRRGDYVTHSKSANIMHTCSLEYYREAVRLICDHVSDPVFYVFSDDMDWVKQWIDFLPSSVLVQHNQGSESYRDMQLMSLCNHNIIANSSFSWWGAWLNRNPKKIVISPLQWFKGKLDDSDLIPPTWTRV